MYYTILCTILYYVYVSWLLLRMLYEVIITMIPFSGGYDSFMFFENK